MSKIPLTARGAQMLQEELKELKTIRRPNVITAIAEARAHGDLRENAEYHAAKEEQGFIEARIKHVESTLGHSQIIDVTTVAAAGRVVFGATVELEDEDDGQTISYQIVGEDEADLKTGRISISSPIARALIGREEGDIVEVSVPNGLRTYSIVEIRYV